MLLPDIDPKIWAKRYKIKLTKRICIKCNKLFESNIPIAVKGYRGFQIPLHECGEEYVRRTWVPIDEEKEKWHKVLFG